ncbi:hypothetical protein DOY81_008476 [Sarcophaga bullata]|nr:hypothetical protein DOY81_008476 [Sarcophaga bullata]
MEGSSCTVGKLSSEEIELEYLEESASDVSSSHSPRGKKKKDSSKFEDFIDLAASSLADICSVFAQRQ